jgi:hypothetical protein
MSWAKRGTCPWKWLYLKSCAIRNAGEGACVSVGGSVGCCSESQKATESRGDTSSGCWAGQQRTRPREDHTTLTLTVAGHALLTSHWKRLQLDGSLVGNHLEHSQVNPSRENHRCSTSEVWARHFITVLPDHIQPLTCVTPAPLGGKGPKFDGAAK